MMVELENGRETARTEMARPAAGPDSPGGAAVAAGGTDSRCRPHASTTAPTRHAGVCPHVLRPGRGWGRAASDARTTTLNTYCNTYKRTRLTTHVDERKTDWIGRGQARRARPAGGPGRSHRFDGTGPTLQRSRTAAPAWPAARRLGRRLGRSRPAM